MSKPSRTENRRIADDLKTSLKLDHEPIAIAFLDAAPDGIERFGAPMSEPAPDGRRGRVPAGCVFWGLAEQSAFLTVPDDHGNCSIGSVTHGLKQVSDVSDNSDVAVLAECGWIENPSQIDLPVVERAYPYIYYGPLAECDLIPDVVFFRLNAKQFMVLKDALSELRVEGKPQCHIIPIAKEYSQPAVSVGCMLSRVRTGMPPSELTCALPYPTITELLDRVSKTAATESDVARFAARDSARFSDL